MAHVYKWKPEDIALLGTMTDRELSKKLGVSHTCVMYKRCALKVKPVKLRKRKIELLTTLAKKMSNEDLSKRIEHPFIGPYSKIIIAERKKRGLPLHVQGRNKKYRHGTETLKSYLVKEALKLVPRPTLEELGQVFSLTRERIRQLGNL